MTTTKQPRCSNCNYTFDDCDCADFQEPKPPPPLLWNDDESWTGEALRIDMRFSQIVRNFIKDYPKYKVRDMEMLLISCVDTVALDMILDKQFAAKTWESSIKC